MRTKNLIYKNKIKIFYLNKLKIRIIFDLYIYYKIHWFYNIIYYILNYFILLYNILLFQ